MHGPLNFLMTEFQPWNDELSLRLPWQQPRASFVWAVCWGNEKCSERLFPLSYEERGLDERACGIALGIGQRDSAVDRLPSYLVSTSAFVLSDTTVW